MFAALEAGKDRPLWARIEWIGDRLYGAGKGAPLAERVGAAMMRNQGPIVEQLRARGILPKPAAPAAAAPAKKKKAAAAEEKKPAATEDQKLAAQGNGTDDGGGGGDEDDATTPAAEA